MSWSFRVFPCGRGDEPVADGHIGRADEPGHLHHLLAYLSASLPHFGDFFLGTYLNPGKAHGPWLGLFAGGGANRVAKTERPDGVGLHNNLQPKLVNKRPLVEVALDRADFSALEGEKVSPRQSDGLSSWGTSPKRTGVGPFHHPFGRYCRVTGSGCAYDFKIEVRERGEQPSGGSG